MPRMTIRQLTGLALLVSAVACDAVSDPAPFLVSDTSSPALSMRLGDTAIVTIDVTNISNSTVLVGPTNCNGDFELVGGNGVSYVPGDRFPCTLALVAPQPLAGRDAAYAGVHHRSRDRARIAHRVNADAVITGHLFPPQHGDGVPGRCEPAVSAGDPF